MATASNSYAPSAEDLAAVEAYHDAGEVLNDNLEKFKVAKENERDTDRVIYGFGNACPLPLADG